MGLEREDGKGGSEFNLLRHGALVLCCSPALQGSHRELGLCAELQLEGINIQHAGYHKNVFIMTRAYFKTSKITSSFPA